MKNDLIPNIYSMVSRASNQFSNAVAGKELASVTKNVRQEAALMRTMKDDYRRVTIRSYDYNGYKLPNQAKIPELPEDAEKEGTQYVVYSQIHQNESDKLSYDMATDYAEDRYTVLQKDKNSEKEFIFNGTYGVGKKVATSNKWLSIEEYMKKYPDAVFLGIGKFKETARIE